MPLKHRTETLLLTLWFLVTAATCILVASLPVLPEGFLPWLIVTLLAAAYALVTVPFLRSQFASGALTAMHLVPVTLCVVWFALQLFKNVPGASVFLHALSWKNAIIVAVPLLMLGFWFALLSLRRVLLRTLIGAAVLGAFLFLTWLPGQHGSLDRQLTAWLWTPSASSSASSQASSQGSSSVVSSASSRSTAATTSASSIASAEESSSRSAGLVAAVIDRLRPDASSSSSVSVSSVRSAAVSSVPTPTHLTSSGPAEVGFLALTCLALYASALHQRARARAA